MPTLLDANAVLRYLLEDSEEQAAEAERAIATGAEVTIEVLAECVYVLSGIYGVSRSMIVESLVLLLDEVTCARGKVAAAALGLYSGGSFDFVDCVLAAEHGVAGREVLTFDKKLRKLLTKVE